MERLPESLHGESYIDYSYDRAPAQASPSLGAEHREDVYRGCSGHAKAASALVWGWAFCNK
jgi:hypothetical protein